MRDRAQFDYECIATYLLRCPHCGAVKKVAFSTTPWSPSVVDFWSDGRTESDKWCEPAYTQQCQQCGHFFTLPPGNTLQIENTPCDAIGMLPYQTLKQAVAELAGEEIPEARARLEAWWAYNALYKETKEDDIPLEEKDFNRANMEWLLTTSPDIEGQTERIRNITIEYNGRHKFYYHLDGKNPNPFCTNTIKLDEEGTTISGSLLVRFCDIILAGKTMELTLPTTTN